MPQASRAGANGGKRVGHILRAAMQLVSKSEKTCGAGMGGGKFPLWFRAQQGLQAELA